MWDDIAKSSKFINETNKEDIGFKTISSIDEDGTTVKFSDRVDNYTASQLELLFPKFNLKKDYRIMVVWDDFAQFTSLGYLDFINTHFIDDDAFNYGTFSFLNRKNEYTDGLKFVKHALEFYRNELIMRYNDTVSQDLDDEKTPELREQVRKEIKENLTFTDEMLLENYKAYYYHILTHSPFNGIFNGLLVSLSHFSQLTLVFKHDFFEMQGVVDGIDRDYNQKQKCSINAISLDQRSLGDIIVDNNPQLIMACDIGKVWEAILNKNLRGIELITNEEHNGLTDEFLYLLHEVSDGSLGPNQCRVSYIKDTISINTPRDGEKV